MPFKTQEFSGQLREVQLRALVQEAGVTADLILETEHFIFFEDAEEWLERNCVQGREARAVKYKNRDWAEVWLVGVRI